MFPINVFLFVHFGKHCCRNIISPATICNLPLTVISQTLCFKFISVDVWARKRHALLTLAHPKVEVYFRIFRFTSIIRLSKTGV